MSSRSNSKTEKGKSGIKHDKKSNTSRPFGQQSTKKRGQSSATSHSSASTVSSSKSLLSNVTSASSSLPNSHNNKSHNNDETFSLNDLILHETLGTGTFGRVVLCEDKRSGEFYALKVLIISEIIRLKQVEHVNQEKAILSEITHPFIVNMFWTHHTSTYLYMLLEYIPGGELFSYLRNKGRFTHEVAQFFTAEIITALDYLHTLNIVYRDLKPENLLIDSKGHLKITDFGFAKKLIDRTWTLCGTPEYLAPEIITGKGHNKAVDWWALGILLYEMIVGFPPFFDDNPFGIYEKILAGKIEFPSLVDSVARDLIKKLLIPDRTKRLGAMKYGANDVKKHRWFRGINWDNVLQKQLKPPILPKLSSAGDTSCFEKYCEPDWNSNISVRPEDLRHFEKF